MLTLTRQLLKLRRLHPALAIGNYRTIDSGVEDCFCYVRQHREQSFLIALNFSKAERLIRFPALRQQRGQLLLSTRLQRETEVDLTCLILQAEEGCLIELEG